jgi:hypothetical protein
MIQATLDDTGPICRVHSLLLEQHVPTRHLYLCDRRIRAALVSRLDAATVGGVASGSAAALLQHHCWGSRELTHGPFCCSSTALTRHPREQR